MTVTYTRTYASTPDAVATRLSTLDRFLPLWIGAAMVGGLLPGRLIPGLGSTMSAAAVQGISLPIAIGLLVMMYPVLAKVRYDRLNEVTADRKLMLSSLMLNWLIGPAVMFTLSWVLLPDLPLGLPQTGIAVSPGQIAASVLIFLGIPLLTGYLSRRLGERSEGRAWYETRFLPSVGPRALYGLLFTIVILFALQGRQITSQPWDVARIAIPLLAYFAMMWAGGHALGWLLRLNYARTTTLAFTAAGNNSNWPLRWRSRPTASRPGRPWPGLSDH